MTPHKHAEVIKAWADGHKIQWRKYDYQRWTDIPASAPVAWKEDVEYRIKPEYVKVTYRRYLYDWGNGKVSVYITHDGVMWQAPAIIEQTKNFYGWIDKEWQVIEVEKLS